jgi:hypothetical protein
MKHECGASERLIAPSLGIVRTSYLRRAAVIGLTLPVPADLDDAGTGTTVVRARRFLCDTDTAAARLGACPRGAAWRGATLMLSWEETGPRIWTVTAIAGSATSMAPGDRASRPPCGRSTLPARSCSSTSPATPPGRDRRNPWPPSIGKYSRLRSEPVAAMARIRTSCYKASLCAVILRLRTAEVAIFLPD